MTNEELATEIAALKAKIAALEAQVKPEPELPPKGSWPKYDPTEGFRLPASAAKAMAAVVPDIKDKKFDAHAWSQTKGLSAPGGFGPAQDKPWPAEVRRSEGRVEASKFEDRGGQFERFDAMVAALVGGPNDTSKLK
jgi:hypothetical protein